MSDQARGSEACRVRLVAGVLVAVLIGIAAGFSVSARADEVFASVGTGEPNGVYYPAGKAICQIVNRDFSMDRVRCSPETTPGSVYNIGALQSGELEFAIVQSDVHFAAYKGEGTWSRRPFLGFAFGVVPLSRARYRDGSRRFAYSGSRGPGRQT